MKPKRMSSRQCLVDSLPQNNLDKSDQLDQLINQSINLKNNTGWDEAITDAKQIIAEAQQKISDLSLGIIEFKRRRDAGEPWPGTSESESGVLGQDGVLGQSPRIWLCPKSPKVGWLMGQRADF